MLRRRVLPLLLPACLLIPATAADAKVSTKKAIWGPVEIDAESQFPVYRDLGAGIYHTTLRWDEVAVLEPLDAKDPEDASYEWPDELDTAIADGKEHGIQIALTVTGTPGWANGDKPARVGPKQPRDFADFLTAASKRYRGVRLWSIWENPTRSSNFQGASASRYARLLDGAYQALKGVSKRNRVIGGNSTQSSVGKWLSRLKLPNGKRPRMDLYGHDPSGAKAPTRSSLRSLERRVRDAVGNKKLYLSPVTLKTSESKQAAWIRDAFKATKRDANVFTLGYRGLIDDSGTPSTYRGLLGSDGTKRPAYNAFKRG